MKNDEPDMTWRVVLMVPPEDGDLDKPYQEGAVGVFHIYRSLTSSEWYVTTPDGEDHIVPDTDEALARLVKQWMKEQAG